MQISSPWLGCDDKGRYLNGSIKQSLSKIIFVYTYKSGIFRDKSMASIYVISIKVFSKQIRKGGYKTLSTSVICSSWHKVEY